MANRDVRTSQSSVNNRRQNTHILYKRQPRKFEQGENVLYVNTKTNTKAHLSICNKLIKERNEHEIIIYCLGAAIQRGILLALQICEQHVSFVIETATFSTELLDDLEPAADNADYEIQKRCNSALRIRVYDCQLL